MYRTIVGLVGTLLAALLLAGVTLSASSRDRADVRFLNGGEPKSIDPNVITGQPGGRIALALFEGLTRYDPETLAPIPGVAKSWEVSEDGRRYTFHLRREALWSDGAPVTAQDFIFSWRRMLDPAVAAQYAYMLYPIEGARALNTFDAHAEALGSVEAALEAAAAKAGGAELSQREWERLLAEQPIYDSLQFCPDPRVRRHLDSAPGALSNEDLRGLVAAIEPERARLRAAAEAMREQFGKTVGLVAPDPYTLEITLEAPTPYFLPLLSFYTGLPVPKHVVEAVGPNWFLPGTLVTNGAYGVERWLVNDRIRLRKSPSYWGRADVKAETIDALSSDNLTTNLNLYLTGEVDWVPRDYPRDLVGELKGRSDFYATAALVVYFYRFNTRRPPLDDRRVRRALALAIDREVIVRDVLAAGELPATGFVPPGIPGYSPPKTTLETNVAEARRLLAEAGFPGGQGFPKLGIVFNTRDDHRQIAELVAAQLQENLGVEVTPYNQEWQSYLATVRTGEYDLARAAWIGDYVDPNTFLDMWVTNGGNNETGFSSPLYDAIIRAAANMPSFAADPDRLLEQLPDASAVAESLRARRASQSPVERRELLHRARLDLLAQAEELLIEEELPILPVYFYTNTGLRSPKLRGHHTELRLPDGTMGPNLQGIFPIRELWMQR